MLNLLLYVTDQWHNHALFAKETYFVMYVPGGSTSTTSTSTTGISQQQYMEAISNKTGLALTAILTMQIQILQLLYQMYQFSHKLHHSSVFPLMWQLLFSSSSALKLTPLPPIHLVSRFYDSSPNSSPISSPISTPASPTSASPIPVSPVSLPTSAAFSKTDRECHL